MRAVRASETHTRTDFESLSGNGLHELGRNGVHHSGGSTPYRPHQRPVRARHAAAGEARAALASLEGRIDDSVLDDIRLLVSELVTNSVRHARAERDLVQLAVAPSRACGARGGLRRWWRFEPHARTRPRDEPGGWGLHLVDSLADRWGVETGRRTRVWFEIEPRPTRLDDGVCAVDDLQPLVEVRDPQYALTLVADDHKPAAALART